MSATTIVPTARSGETGKIVTAREAVRLIRTGHTVAVGGFGGIGIAEEVVHELGELYKASDAQSASFAKPGDLTLFFGVGQGQPFTGRGLNRLAEPGLVNRVIADGAFAEGLAGVVERISSGAPLVARWHKRMVKRLEEPRPVTREERHAPLEVFDSEDYRLGTRAFLEKRAPVFVGR